MDNKQSEVDPFKKCKECNHTWSDHYNLLPLEDGAEYTPKHENGACGMIDCPCRKFSE